MKTIDTTMFKTFASLNDLFVKAGGKTIFIELSNGYFIPVTKKAIRLIAKSMSNNEDNFCGQITFLTGQEAIQVKIAK